MAKFDSAETMRWSLNENPEHIPCWQCEDCGRKFTTLNALESNPCAAHKGIVKCHCSEKAKFNFELYGGLWNTIHSRKKSNNNQHELIKEKSIPEQRAEKWLRIKDISINLLNTIAIDMLAIYIPSLKEEWGIVSTVLTKLLISRCQNAKQNHNIDLKEWMYPWIDILENNLKNEEFWRDIYVISKFGLIQNRINGKDIELEKATLQDINNNLVIPLLNHEEERNKCLQCLKGSLIGVVYAMDHKINYMDEISWRNRISDVANRLDDDNIWKSLYVLPRLY